MKSTPLELNFKKKGKISVKSQMFTSEEYQKIIQDVVDPNFVIQLKRDKLDIDIIKYLNKPSVGKYRFLVGWF